MSPVWDELHKASDFVAFCYVSVYYEKALRSGSWNLVYGWEDSRLKHGSDLGPFDQYASAYPTELPGLLITHLEIAFSKLLAKV